MVETTFEEDIEPEVDPTELMSDRELLIATFNFVKEIKRQYDIMTDDMELNSRALEYVLGVTRRTLVRWRNEGVIRYRVDEKGNNMSSFKEIFTDVKSGRITGRGFSRDAALRRLRLYRLGVIKGSMELDYEQIYGE